MKSLEKTILNMYDFQLKLKKYGSKINILSRILYCYRAVFC